MNINYNKILNIPESLNKHAQFLPTNIFMIIAGSTGCGKTNLLMNFLYNPGVLSYSDVYVYCSTLHQPIWQAFISYCSTLEEIPKQYGINHKIGHFFDSDEDIKNPSELDPSVSHIMVFDDVMNVVQSVMKDYFTKGRHNNVNVFYLCQSLHKIKKHCIRDNANIFILFHQDDKTLKYFYESHLSGDMDFKELKKFCNEAWSKKHGYVVINLWEESSCGRYLDNYEKIYIPSKYIKMHKNA